MPDESLQKFDAVLALDADAQGVCIMARSIDKFKNGRWKRFFHFSASRPDPETRVKLPCWLNRAMKADAVEIRVEGGKQGSVWREFCAWCDESSKGRL